MNAPVGLESALQISELKTMLNSLPAALVGFIAALALALNTLFWVPILLVFSLLRLLLPLAAVRRGWPRAAGLAEA